MAIVANLHTVVNTADAQRISLETTAHGTYLLIEELPHRLVEGETANWQPKARIALGDAIEATKAMLEAVKLLEGEDFGTVEEWQEIHEDEGIDWDAYCLHKEREMEERLDALADSISAEWGWD